MPTRVAIVRCEDYSGGNLRAALEEALALLGDLDELAAGADVLLKPNLLSPRPPEDGVVTHPALVRTVAEIFLQRGCRVGVGDSPGGRVKRFAEVWRKSGTADALAGSGAYCAEFRSVAMVPVPGGVVASEVPIGRPVLDAGFLVDLPKLKTHQVTILTGAVKNMFGAVAGLAKGELHKAAPDPVDFAEAVCDVYSVVKPHLVIMDAITCMEGDGPVGGTLRQLGLILAGTDAVAVDTVAAEMIGLPAKSIPVLEAAGRRGLGCNDIEQIEVVGLPLDSVRVRDYALPRESMLGRLPRWVLYLAARYVRAWPHPSALRCTRCGECIAGCPVGALSWTTGAGAPVLDKCKCIRCLCCYEFCPSDAVELRRSIVARLFF